MSLSIKNSTTTTLAASVVALGAAYQVYRWIQRRRKGDLPDLYDEIPPGGNILFTLQEIVSVEIEETDVYNPSNWLLLRDNSNYYVSFTHGEEDKGHVPESLPLKKPRRVPNNNQNGGAAPSDRAVTTALVNWHIYVEDDKPLICKIYRSRPLVPDELIGSAVISADALKSLTETEETVERAILTPGKNRATDTKLRIEFRKKQWNEIYSRIDVRKSSDISTFFKMAEAVLKLAIKRTDNPTASELKPPTEPANPNLEMISFLNGVLSFPKDGEFATVTKDVRWQMAIMNCLPFYDRQTPYLNRSHAIFRLRQRVLGQDLIPAPPEGKWQRINSDETMTRCWFSSLGQYCLRRDDNGGFVSDTLYLGKNYKYRNHPEKPYQPYGAKVMFNDKGAIQSIQDVDGNTYEPGDKYWEWAKLLARSSAFVHVAMVHVCCVHYKWGNVPGTAMRMYLKPTHPVRQAFSVHFYKTAYTATRARYSLFDERGILIRGTSLEYKGGLEDVFRDLLVGFEFKHFPDELKAAGIDDVEFLSVNEDAIDLHGIFMKYVDSYFDSIYPSNEALQQDGEFGACHYYMVERMGFENADKSFNLDNVKKIWGEVLFRVTGFHSAVGQVSAWALDPSMVNLRLQKKEVEDLIGTEESAISIALITAITTVPCPQLWQDWRQVFGEFVPEAYEDLREDLDNLQVTIDKRNADRKWPNVDYHPKHCAISISS